MAKKSIIAVAILISVVFYFVKVGNFIGVDQHNKRAEFNNSVVRVLSDLSETMHGPRSFLVRFTALDELDESQQRGMWYLIEDMHYDHSEEIEAARNELDAMTVDSNDAEMQLIAAAKTMADSFSGFSEVYNELADTIRERNLDSDALATELASAFEALNQREDRAADDFAEEQTRFVDGA